MAYRIIETVILTLVEIQEENVALNKFIYDEMERLCMNGHLFLHNPLKVHYTDVGYILEYDMTEWDGNLNNRGFLEVKDPSLVDHYFTKHTSQTWQKLLPLITVIDPDGWDRSNYDYSWKEEMITRREYDERVLYSTCMQMR
jgi:hypothetical protein